MPISPAQLKEKVIEESDVSGVVLRIEEELFRTRAVNGGTIMTMKLEDFVAEKVAKEFSKVGWHVSYQRISDQRDGDYTAFTLTPA